MIVGLRYAFFAVVFHDLGRFRNFCQLGGPGDLVSKVIDRL